MQNDNIINFNCFYNGLKIITVIFCKIKIIQKHDSIYKNYDQFIRNNYFNSTEKIYKKVSNFVPEEDSI